MRSVAAALITAGVVGWSGTARAQVNFQLFPEFGTVRGTTIIYTAWVISFRDSKLYLCSASTNATTAPTLSCGVQGAFNPPLWTGDNVMTSQILGLAPGETTAALSPRFWQIDQATGQVQFCQEPAILPQTRACVASQIP